MTSKPTDILQRYWGFSTLYSGQQKTIDNVLQGRNTLTLMPTGGGKSLCYQIPALMFKGVTIVVSPLISLMENQVRVLQHKGIPSQYINSTLDTTQINEYLNQAISGKLRLLYITPERILTVSFLKALEHIKVSLIAVDEAHCISQWGHDFRPSYRNISELVTRCKCPVLALTATATPQVAQDIRSSLGFDENASVVIDSFARENLSYQIIKTDERLSILLSLLRDSQGSVIVYCGTRADIHYISQVLDKNGISSAQYHAGLPTSTRTKAQSEWLSGNKKVMLATSAFGMGIDKPDVRLVVHWYVPGSVEDYFQEAGRAGRDGQYARSIILMDESALSTMRYHCASSVDPKYILKVYHRICAYCGMAEGDFSDMPINFSFDDFCIRYSEDSMRARMAISWLTRIGVLNFYGTEYLRSRIKILLSAQAIYSMAENALTECLEVIVRSTDGVFAYLCDINVEELAPRAGMTIEQFEVYLSTLASRGLVEYYPSRKYQLLVFPSIRHTQAVEMKILSSIKNSSERKANRGKYMEQYIATDKCRSMWMQNYFGEKTDRSCGVCSNCSIGTKGRQEIELSQVFEGKNLTLKQISRRIGKSEKEMISILRVFIEDGRVEFDGINKFKFIR